MNAFRMLVILPALLISTVVFAAQPFGRASIEGSDGIVPGQQVHVVVDVFAPAFFTSPPQYPLLEVPDALVALSDDRPQNLVQTIDGIQYSGIRRSYVVVPEKAGSFSLPDIDVTLSYSVGGSAVKATVAVDLPSFDAAEAATGTSAPFAARNLIIKQSFDRDPADLKKGDALVRTIVVFAEDTQAMLMPPIDLGDASGVTTYLKPPVLADGVKQRGLGRDVETGSTRTDTIVYTTSNEGSFLLPAISYPWFDVDGHEGNAATLPAVTMVVAQAAASERLSPTLEDKSVPSSLMSKSLLITVLVAAIDLAAAFLAWRHFKDIRALMDRFQERRRNSPQRRLRHLRRIIRVGSDDAIYRELQVWSGSLGFRTLSAWVDAQRNTKLAAHISILETCLFRSADTQLDRTALASLIQVPRTERTGPRNALPELNPTAGRSMLPPLLR